MEKRRREELEVEFKEARHRLEADMEIAYQDYQTQLLREGKRFEYFKIKLLF
jgi:5,10-methylenetetrahydrofolate reductase